MRERTGAPRFTREEENVLLDRMRGGDSEAGNLLAESMRPWSIRLCMRYSGKGIDEEELESLAFCGVAEALRKWEPHKGRLITITTWYVLRIVRLALLEESTTIHIPNYLFSKQSVGTKNYEAAQLAHKVLSLDYEMMGMDGTIGTLGQSVPDSHNDIASYDEDEFNQSEVAMLRRAIGGLDDRKRQVIMMRLEGKTLQQIGDEVGCTRERIRQILLKITEILRDEIVGE